MHTLLSSGMTAPLPEQADLSPARRRLFETALALFSRQRLQRRVGARHRGRARPAPDRDLRPRQLQAGAAVRADQDRPPRSFATASAPQSSKRGREPVDQLRAIVFANAQTHLTFPELARVSHGGFTPLSPEQYAVIDVFRRDLGGLLRDVTQRGIDQGVFNPADVAITLAAVSSLGVNIVDWWTPELGLDIDHIAATHADLAIRMLTRD